MISLKIVIFRESKNFIKDILIKTLGLEYFLQKKEANHKRLAS